MSVRSAKFFYRMHDKFYDRRRTANVKLGYSEWRKSWPYFEPRKCCRLHGSSMFPPSAALLTVTSNNIILIMGAPLEARIARTIFSTLSPASAI